MTETENTASFVSALNEAIESARMRLGEPDAFLAATRGIESLIESGLPPVLEAARTHGISEDDREQLEAGLAALAELQSGADARVVWSRDFEDYMRAALSGEE